MTTFKIVIFEILKSITLKFLENKNTKRKSLKGHNQTCPNKKPLLSFQVQINSKEAGELVQTLQNKVEVNQNLIYPH